MIEPTLVVIVLLALIGAGAPIFLALGTSGLLGLWMARGPIAFFFAPTSFFGQLNSFELIALPLFILMGNLLGATPVGANLFKAAALWLQWLKGGLAISTVGASAVFGAVSGVSVAAVAVASSGALAMLIPPSVPFIIYGAVSGVSVGALFVGGIVPGIALALALSLYIYIRVSLNPEEAPRDTGPKPALSVRIKALGGIWHALLLIFIVLGAIYSGFATPSEAAAFGAAGAFLIAAGIFRVLTLQKTMRILESSVKVSGTILLIIGCARIFGDYLNLVRVPELITEALVSTPLPDWTILVILMLALVVLGMLVDAVSLIVVTTPILLPLIVTMGFDPLWFGIILVMNLEIAVVTPPVGLNLYALRGVCPMLRIETIIRSVLPFVAVQFVVLMIFVLFPQLSLWLPSLL